MQTVSAQSYKFRKVASILGTEPDDYALTVNEYHSIYSFYVTYSMCKSLSDKKRSFIDYGWISNSTTNPAVEAALKGVLNLQRNSEFVFTKDNDLAVQFSNKSLTDGPINDLSWERAVIGITSESSNYFRLFHHIRNGLAHGKFKLRKSDDNEKMIVIQDNDQYNVTARIVLKLSTILAFIEAIDLNDIINRGDDLNKTKRSCYC